MYVYVECGYEFVTWLHHHWIQQRWWLQRGLCWWVPRWGWSRLMCTDCGTATAYWEDHTPEQNLNTKNEMISNFRCSEVAHYTTTWHHTCKFRNNIISSVSCTCTYHFERWKQPGRWWGSSQARWSLHCGNWSTFLELCAVHHKKNPSNQTIDVHVIVNASTCK